MIQRVHVRHVAWAEAIWFTRVAGGLISKKTRDNRSGKQQVVGPRLSVLCPSWRMRVPSLIRDWWDGENRGQTEINYVERGSFRWKKLSVAVLVKTRQILSFFFLLIVGWWPVQPAKKVGFTGHRECPVKTRSTSWIQTDWETTGPLRVLRFNRISRFWLLGKFRTWNFSFFFFLLNKIYITNLIRHFWIIMWGHTGHILNIFFNGHKLLNFNWPI